MITIDDIDVLFEAIEGSIDTRYETLLFSARNGGRDLGEMFGNGYFDDINTSLTDEERVEVFLKRKDKMVDDILQSFLNRYGSKMSDFKIEGTQNAFLEGVVEGINNIVEQRNI